MPPIGFMILQMHEGQSDLFMDPHDRSGRSRSDTGTNPAKAQTMKTMLSEHRTQVWTLEFDKDGKRRPVEYTTFTSNVWMININWDFYDVPAPIASRFNVVDHLTPTTTHSSESATAQFRPRAVESAAAFMRIIKQSHLLHGMYILVEYILGCAVLPHGVQMDGATMLTEKIYECMTSEMGVSGDMVKIRKRQCALQYMRIVTIMHAIFQLVATAEGHRFLDESGYYTPFCWEAIRDFILPRLIIDKRTVVWVLGLLSYQYVVPWGADVMMAVAHKVSVDTPRFQQPLRVQPSDMVGDRNLMFALGIMTHPAPGGAHDMITLGAPAGGMLSMLGSSGATLSNGDLVDDHRYLVFVDSSLRNFAIAIGKLLLDHTGAEPRTESIESFILDKKTQYVTSRFYRRSDDDGSLQIVTRDNGEIPTDRIPMIVLKKHVQQTANGQLKETNKLQLGIAIDCLVQYYALPVSPELHEEDIYQRLLSNFGSNGSITHSYLREYVRTPACKRMDQLIVSEERAKSEEFIEWLSTVDPLNVVAAAVKRVLETPSLNLMRQWRDGYSALSTHEEKNDTMHLLIYSQPPNFSIRVCRPNKLDQLVYVGMGYFMQRLTIRRSTTGVVPVFKNESRGRYTGFRQIEASVRPTNVAPRVGEEASSPGAGAAAPPKDRFIEFIQSVGFIVDFDFDYFQVLVHREQNPQPTNVFYRTLTNRILVDPVLRRLLPPNSHDDEAPVNLHAFHAYRDAFFVASDMLMRLRQDGSMGDEAFGDNGRLVHVRLREQAHRIALARAEEYNRSAVLDYPRSDIRQEINSVSQLNEEVRSSKFKSIVSIASVMLEDTRYLGAMNADNERLLRCSRHVDLDELTGAVNANVDDDDGDSGDSDDDDDDDSAPGSPSGSSDFDTMGMIL